MRSIFFIVCLVMALACPLWAGEQHSMQQEAGSTDGPDMHEDSGLTWYQIAGLLAAIGTSTALGWQGCKKMNAIRIEPQPLEVQLSKDYVTRSEFEDYRKQVSGEIENVHKRLDNVTPAVAQMQGKLDMIAANQDKILNLLMTGRAAGAGDSGNRQS